MSGRLAGKRALVTAAGAGIGAAIARAFHAEGAAVLATDLDPGALDALPEGVERAALDVTDPEAVERVAGGAAANVLANCAGWVHHGDLLATDDEAFERSWRINVEGAHRVTRAVVPGMLERGGGSVVFVASAVGSMIAAPNRYAYGTTKAAVVGLTKSVAADYVARGVRANAICPGTVDSPSWRDRVRALGETMEGGEEAARAAFVARQPMGRVGRAEEVAALAVHLASDESAFTTGQAIAVDGGWANT